MVVVTVTGVVMMMTVSNLSSVSLETKIKSKKTYAPKIRKSQCQPNAEQIRPFPIPKK